MSSMALVAQDFEAEKAWRLVNLAEYVATKDPGGCPVIRYDGPYQFRCGLGAEGGICAYHGRFR